MSLHTPPTPPTTTGLGGYPWQDRYSSSRDDLVAAFFEPALDRSSRYDRAVGYFRSSIYSLVGRAVVRFGLRGGRIRLLCSPELTDDDKQAIQRGLDIRGVVDQAAARELERVLQHSLAGTPVDTLANLVGANILDIRFALMRHDVGVFHDKLGLFSDADTAVSFSGSINESWQAWHPLGNHEAFEVFRSWLEPQRVEDHRYYFESLWDGSDPDIDVYEAGEAFRRDLLRRAKPEPLEALKQRGAEPARPQRHLLDHQRDALTCWVSRRRRGILKHATGSGKTLTALHGIRDWLAEGKPAIVFVPSELLLDQWANEAREELSLLQPSVLLVGGGHDEWRRSGLLRLHTEVGATPRLTIAIIHTARTYEFRKRLSDNADLLVVTDEVHRLGSPENQNALCIDATARLGLSATPERYGDPTGTQILFDYFGPILEPVFTLRDAISVERLVPYVYEPSTVGLTEDETEDWIARTARIRQIYAREAEEVQHGRMSDYLRTLLIQRARIAKKAAMKLTRACDLVESGWQTGDHWLVYCEDTGQLRTLLGELRQRGIDALEYHSQMGGDRDATLNRYKQIGGVLVSIRCLDEGVDIPDISHALILASSRNSREFVQRRGRVLRTAPGKYEATIYDLLVVPASETGADAFDSLVFGEVSRAAEFAKDAVNDGALVFLKRLCIKLGIDPDTLVAAGIEDE